MVLEKETESNFWHLEDCVCSLFGERRVCTAVKERRVCIDDNDCDTTDDELHDDTCLFIELLSHKSELKAVKYRKSHTRTIIRRHTMCWQILHIFRYSLITLLLTHNFNETRIPWENHQRSALCQVSHSERGMSEPKYEPTTSDSHCRSDRWYRYCARSP